MADTATTQTAPDLLPCPFCGVTPELHGVHVECHGPACHVQPISAGPTEHDAITRWNARAALEQPPASALQLSLEEQVAYWRRQWEFATDQVTELSEKLRAALEQPARFECPDCHIPGGCVVGQCSIGCRPPVQQPGPTGAPSEPDLYVDWSAMAAALSWMGCTSDTHEAMAADPGRWVRLLISGVLSHRDKLRASKAGPTGASTPLVLTDRQIRRIMDLAEEFGGSSGALESELRGLGRGPEFDALPAAPGGAGEPGLFADPDAISPERRLERIKAAARRMVAAEGGAGEQQP